MSYPKFKLNVLSLTYNHAPYIVDTMDGFCMQQTNFPFVCCIIDDASTDGEQEVISKYMNDYFFLDDECSKQYDTEYAKVLYAKNKYNENCYFAVLLLKKNLNKQPNGLTQKLKYISEWRIGCQYEALCEGDDYWTNENKLQIQVDFLDNHNDFSICSHRIKKYDQDEQVYYVDRLDSMFVNKAGCEFNNRTKVWISETSSIVYRQAADVEYKKYPHENRDNVHMYYLLKYGKGFCFSSKMSVYRQHKGGMFSKQDIHTRLINGSYKAMKNLYEYERTPDSRYLYYRCYALVFLLTKGRAVFFEKFDFFKFLSLLYFIPSVVVGKHPVYQNTNNDDSVC